MGLYYQAFTGGAAGRGVAAEDILRRLRNVPVQAVIVGWSEDPALYRELGEALHRRGAELWLWFRVLTARTLREGLLRKTGLIYTDIPDLQDASVHSLWVGLRRQTGLLTGAPLGARVFDGDETFDFCCPSQAGLAQRLLEKYDCDFAGCAFDGMFLDRIRYPSLTVGAEALFGCACGECRDWLAENGLPRQVQDDLAQRIAARMSDEDCIDPLGLLQYCAGQYIFADPALETLLRLKCQRIESVVRVLCGGFRSRGMKVAMDLFAPFLAPLVGQDYRRLGAMADFIKPMLYRHTFTPAGLSFELDAMARAVSEAAPAAYAARRAYLRQVTGMDGDTGGFFERELAAIPPVGRVVPGIELHTAEGLPPVRRTDIADSVHRVEQAGYFDRVACWDILSADQKAIETFAGIAGRDQD